MYFRSASKYSEGLLNMLLEVHAAVEYLVVYVLLIIPIGFDALGPELLS